MRSAMVRLAHGLRILAAVAAACGVGLVAGASSVAQDAAVAAGIEAYNRGELAAAYRLLRAAADRGDADAQVNLGYMYARGQVVKLDQREALRLYRLSAEQGNGEGMNALGFKYQYGTGVAADIDVAVQWYCRAIARGNPRALNNLAILHREGNGVPRDYAEARSLWQQAADLGNVNGMYNLGTSYLFGPGEPLDKPRGMSLIARAARLGHADAQQLPRRAGYGGPLPAPVDTVGRMQLVPKHVPPGRARYCGALIS
jgi:TPR repeat protein